jgi:hypothetical protein
LCAGMTVASTLLRTPLEAGQCSHVLENSGQTFQAFQ